MVTWYKLNVNPKFCKRISIDNKYVLLNGNKLNIIIMYECLKAKLRKHQEINLTKKNTIHPNFIEILKNFSVT